MKKSLDNEFEVTKDDKENKDRLKIAENMIQNFSLYAAHITLQAMMTRAKYNALLSQGFTKEQALDLCKEWKK